MSESSVKIPEKVISGVALEISADSDIEYVRIYESPRTYFLESDKKKENPIWTGDIFLMAHGPDFETNKKVVLNLVRGPDNKPILYGRYLVIVGLANGAEKSKIIEVLHKV